MYKNSLKENLSLVGTRTTVFQFCVRAPPKIIILLFYNNI